jgi:hypothetical protein
MCRRCQTPVPEGSPEELYELGWNEGLCPSCRAERNARAAATAGRIASGLAGMFATRWGPATRTATIRELPGMAVRSVWALGPDIVEPEMARVWAKLGEGAYLLTIESGGRSENVVVDVGEDGVEMEPIDAGEVQLLPALYAAAAVSEPVRQLN